MTTWLTSGDREPGSGWRDDAEAAAANDAIRDGRWADVALIRAMFEEPTPGPRFKPPPKSEWFDDCEYARGGGETVCAPAPQVNLAHDTQVDEAITRNTYGEEVNIADDCPESFKELFRVAWTFLVDNEDIVRWATCLVHGVSFRDRIVEKLTQGWFLDFKADIGCDDGGEFGGPCLAHATASSGPVIGIEVCVESGGDASKWLDLFENGTSVEKLCGVVEAATLLFHELNHVAATWDSMDYFESKNHKLHEKCTGSHVSESIWRWAIYQRFPQALEAACCSDLFELNDDGSWDFDEQYMNGNPPSLDHECEVAGVD